MEIAEHSTNDKARCYAATVILERGLGKPKIQIASVHDDKPVITTIKNVIIDHDGRERSLDDIAYTSRTGTRQLTDRNRGNGNAAEQGSDDADKTVPATCWWE